MADLAYVQGRAVSTQKRQFVRFDLVNNRYEVLEQMTPSETIITHPVNKTPFTVQLGSTRKDDLKDVVLDAVAFDTKTVLMYDELGTPHAYDATTHTSAAMASGSVRLKAHDYTMTITIEPYSGELKIN
jgi:hypothetical protein